MWIGNPKLRMAGICFTPPHSEWGVKVGGGVWRRWGRWFGTVMLCSGLLVSRRGVTAAPEAAVGSVQREGALLLSGKQMKRFDCHFWSEGSLECCREETESCRQRSRRGSPVAWISQKTSCTSETPRELITRLTLTTVFGKALPN